MLIKKRTRLYLFVCGAVGIALTMCNRQRNESVSINHNRLLAINMARKVKYYDYIADSSIIKKIPVYYDSLINELCQVTEKIDVLGERCSLKNDTILLQVFALSKQKGQMSVNFITSINGRIEKHVMVSKANFPDFPAFCNEHYFFLHPPRNRSMIYNGYSLTLNSGTILDLKVFFSEKFDSFNNTICKCDESELSQIIDYINIVFDKD